MSTQQIFQQVDYRLALLDAATRELRRLQKAQAKDRQRELTAAALEALKVVTANPPTEAPRSL